MFNPFLFMSNRTGIPRIATTAVTVGTDAVTFTVPSNNSFYNNYNGLILFKMTQSIPDGTTDTLPIALTSNAGTKEVTVLGGGDWTVANFQTGIHLMYFESETGTLQVLV